MAQTQVDLSTIDKDMVGPRTQVLVLGSMHLNEISGGFEHETLEPLMARLEAFAPEVITIERVSGEQCDMVMRHPRVYNVETWKQRVCFDTGAAQAATGLDVPAAIGQVHVTLRDWPDSPAPAQRRRLAALFLAAGEPESALVQWLQLEDGERRTGDMLDEALVATLEKYEASDSESSLIAARLAARLGLARVHPTDDHTGDDGHIEDLDAYAAAIQRAWDTAAEMRRPLLDREQALVEAGDMLAAYRLINTPRVRQTMVESDFGAALRDPSPERHGRFYVGGWETRNLRMVANIREAFRGEPGARVLSVVGAMHKPWFDSLLGQMQGVEIMDVREVLE